MRKTLDEGVMGEPSSTLHASRVRRLEQVRAWAPVFGDADVATLDSYDLVVVDGLGDEHGAQLSRTSLAPLHASGALVLSYLSVGTVEKWRLYARQVPSSWTLAEVEEWPDERYVDARERGWQQIMETQARHLERRGFDGLYLDNLDVAEDFPATRAGLTQLVKRLRTAVPDMLLVAQNGLAIADELPIDAIAHEDVFGRWDDGYRASTPDETAAIVGGLRRMRARGLPVLTLDYATPRSDTAREAVARSRAEGFLPAVSVLELDRPPHAPARS
jgi:uncharacterized protein (TIGR01370 family)